MAEGVALTDSIRAVTRRIAVSRERQLGVRMAETEIHYGWAPLVILVATFAGLVIVGREAEGDWVALDVERPAG